jgi:hypothetical protein
MAGQNDSQHGPGLDPACAWCRAEAMALLAELTKEGPVINEQHGVFADRLPPLHQGYKIMLAPGWDVSHINAFANGTQVVTIKRAKSGKEPT